MRVVYRTLIGALGLFILTGCSKENAPEVKTLRFVCSNIAAHAYDPNQYFDYLVKNENKLYLANSSFGIDADQKNESALGALAQMFAEWEDWDHALYFARKSLSTNPDETFAVGAMLEASLIGGSFETQARPLVAAIRPDSLIARSRMMYWIDHNDFDQALKMYSSTEKSSQNSFARTSLIPVLMIWFSRQNKVEDMNTFLENYSSNQSVKLFCDYIIHSGDGSDGEYVALAFAYAYEIDKSAHNLKFAEKWKEEGMEIVATLRNREPGNLWIAQFLTSKFQ